MVSAIFLRKLLRDLWLRKFALLALLVILAIGVGVFVGFAAVYRDMDGARERYYRKAHVADFQVDLKRLDRNQIATVRGMTNVSRIEGRIVIPAQVRSGREEDRISGRAISLPAPRQPQLYQVTLRTGAWFSDDDRGEVILNHQFALAHGLRPGAVLAVKILEKEHRLTVVGTADSAEFVYLIPPTGGLAPDPGRFAVIYLPYGFLSANSELGGAVNQLVGTVFDSSKTVLSNTLSAMARRFDAEGVVLTSSAEDLPSFRFLADELHGLKIQSQVLPGIFLGTAALILSVLLSRLVVSQRGIIGTLMALGYHPHQITLHYLSYGAALALGGGLCGVVIGAQLQSAMLALYRQFYLLPGMAPQVHLDLLAGGIALGVAAGVGGALHGVRKITKLQPSDAMRTQPPQVGGRIVLERVKPLWRRISPAWRSVLRGVFRNRFRAGVNFGACLVSTSLIVATLGLADSLDFLMTHEFERVAHEDFSYFLREPKDSTVIREIMSANDGVAIVEPQLNIGAVLSSGSFSKRVPVLGLAPRARLTTPRSAKGTAVIVPERGLVIGRKLAEILHVGPGDVIKFRPLQGRRVTVDAPVGKVVETYLGLSAYTSYLYLSRLLGESAVANTLLTKFHNPDRAGARPGSGWPVISAVGERKLALSTLQSTFGETMGAALGISVLFAGLIAFGGALNVAFVSLSEREREVGTLRVLGYGPFRVAGFFTREVLLTGIFGIGFGVLGGIALAHGISSLYSTELYRFPVVVRVETIALACGLMLLFVLAAQAVLYRLILKFDWLSVLNIKE